MRLGRHCRAPPLVLYTTLPLLLRGHHNIVAFVYYTEQGGRWCVKYPLVPVSGALEGGENGTPAG